MERLTLIDPKYSVEKDGPCIIIKFRNAGRTVSVVLSTPEKAKELAASIRFIVGDRIKNLKGICDILVGIEELMEDFAEEFSSTCSKLKKDFVKRLDNITKGVG